MNLRENRILIGELGCVYSPRSSLPGKQLEKGQWPTRAIVSPVSFWPRGLQLAIDLREQGRHVHRGMPDMSLLSLLGPTWMGTVKPPMPRQISLERNPCPS